MSRWSSLPHLITWLPCFALQPQVIAHVLHHDKYEADVVLGVASIPMTPLMEQMMFDTYTSVFGAPSRGRREKAKIGSLRVVLALEDLSLASHGDKRTAHQLGGPLLSLWQREGSLHSEQKDVRTNSKINSAKATEHVDSGCPKRDSASDSKKSQTPLSSGMPEHISKDHPDIEMAWEFETWRRAEETKWRAEMKEREVVRMNMLEADWEKREKQRNNGVHQAEKADLEAPFREKLDKLEKRERALVLAEESIIKREEDLDCQYARRSSEAQVTLNKLQAECEHQVEIEEAKYAALQDQYNVMQKRLTTANASLLAVEKQFLEYRTAQRGTSEGELLGQITTLKQLCSDMQKKVETSVHAKSEYKAQVLKLAKQLARSKHQVKELESRMKIQERERLQAQEVAYVAQSQDSRQERSGLQHLKEQLDRLQSHERDAMVTRDSSSTVLSGSSYRNLLKSGNLAQIGKDGTNQSNKQEYSDGGSPTDLRVFREGDSSPLQGMPLSNVNYKHEGPLKPCLITERRARFADDEPDAVEFENEIKRGHRWYDSDDTEEMSITEREVARLSEQRAELLQSGVYTANDRIIKGLNLEIQRMKVGLGLRSPF